MQVVPEVFLEKSTCTIFGLKSCMRSDFTQVVMCPLSFYMSLKEYILSCVTV